MFFRLLHQMIHAGPGQDVGGQLNNESMIARLKRGGTLSNPAVEKAMLVVPRGEFVTKDLLPAAYVGAQ